MERVKPIVITDDESGKEYTIEFNRASVMYAERQGFDFTNISKYPLTAISDLFYYGLRWHHPNISKEQSYNLLDSLGGISNLPEGFIQRLGELYALAYESVKNSHLTIQF